MAGGDAMRPTPDVEGPDWDSCGSSTGGTSGPMLSRPLTVERLGPDVVWLVSTGMAVRRRRSGGMVGGTVGR